MKPKRILIADDDELMRQNLAGTVRALGHECETAAGGAEALERLLAGRFDTALCDILMPKVSGLEVLKRLRASGSKMPVVLMTGFSSPATAIEATKLGAIEYLEKPFTVAQLQTALEAALKAADRMAAPVSLGRPPEEGGVAIIGRSRAMMEVYKEIGRVAALPVSVLIRGETGTGKELVARAIYHHGSRSDRAFVAVNCAAIPEGLLESELFGHEKGAFTGAVTRLAGRFEQADGGTLFLDEIGDMSLQTQSKVLRVIEDGVVCRLGGREPIRVDVRLLAATNRPLEEMIQRREFRADLFHRLNTVTITLPPLRERREDIPDLAAFFLGRAAADLGFAETSLTPEAVRALEALDWPGNVRQLQNIVRRALIISRGYPVAAEHITAALREDAAPGAGARQELGAAAEKAVSQLVSEALALAEKGEIAAALPFLLQKVERALLTAALARTGGNRTRAARLIGVTNPTLRSKLKEHGLGAAAPEDS